jgi:hypothetical protein
MDSGSAAPTQKHRRAALVLAGLAVLLMVTGTVLGFGSYFPITTNHELSGQTSPWYLFRTSTIPTTQQLNIQFYGQYNRSTQQTQRIVIFDLGSSLLNQSNGSYVQRLMLGALPFQWDILASAGYHQMNGSVSFSTTAGSWILVLDPDSLSLNAPPTPPIFITVTSSSPIALVGFTGGGLGVALAVFLWRSFGMKRNPGI